MINHIFDNTPHHYHNFMGFFSRECGQYSHRVYVRTSGDSHLDTQNLQQLAGLGYEAVVYHSNDELLVIIARNRTQAFIFHSLASRKLWFGIVRQGLWHNCSWVCWGADSYQYLQVATSFKARLKRWIAKQVQATGCKLMQHVVALNPGDGKLLAELFGRKQIDVVPYPLVGVDAGELIARPEERELVILLGNSAAVSNNHDELLDGVAHLADSHVRIVMPLNYAGPAEHVNKIVARGQALFGDKFEPLLEMLSKQQYDALLERVDVCVFAHDRQQGLYVAYYMLLSGKKLFLKDSTSSYSNFIDYGFSVEPLSSLPRQDAGALAKQDLAAAATNQQIFDANFSEAALGPRWAALFSQLSSQSAPSKATAGQEA